MRRLLLSRVAGLIVSLAALPLVTPSAFAQGTAWEYVGGAYGIRDLYLHDDGVLWAGAGRLLKMLPGTDEWIEVHRRGPSVVLLTETGALLTRRISSIQRSTDGGATFSLVYPDATSESPLHDDRGGPYDGRVFIGQSTEGVEGAAYSDDDGLTWTEGPIGPEGQAFGHPSVFLVVPDGPHAGRVLAGAINGIAYSDDGGDSWALSELWEYLGFEAFTFTCASGPNAGPLAGRLYAGVADTSFGRLYYSDDGGVTWTPQREFGGGRFRLLRTEGGVLLSVTNAGVVWRSDDGGATWAESALPPLREATGNPNVRVEDVLIDEEGRLNVALVKPGVNSAPNGLWRSVLSVVAAEMGPGQVGTSGVEMAVYPNPAAGEATVMLTLAEAAEVTLAVYDVLGRRVVTLADGRVEAGTHRFALNGPALPLGLYLVRAELSGEVITQRITILR